MAICNTHPNIAPHVLQPEYVDRQYNEIDCCVKNDEVYICECNCSCCSQNENNGCDNNCNGSVNTDSENPDTENGNEDNINWSTKKIKLFIPELNYWISKCLENTSSKLKFVENPIKLSDAEWKDNNSFFDILFNYNHKSDESFNFAFNSVNYLNLKDKAKLIRLSIFGNNVWTYVLNKNIFYSDIDNIFSDDKVDEKINLFNFTYKDLFMINLIHKYKNNQLIDEFNDIEYNQMVTPLSKLVYLYLINEITGDIQLYHDEIQKIENNINSNLVYLYYKYVIDHYYRKFTVQTIQGYNQQINYFSEKTCVSKYITLTEQEINEKQWIFPIDEKPSIYSKIYIFSDCKLYERLNKDFSTLKSPDNKYCITWDKLNLDNNVSLTNNTLYIIYSVE